MRKGTDYVVVPTRIENVRSEGNTAMTPPELNTYRNSLGASRRSSSRNDTEHTLSANRDAAGRYVAPDPKGFPF